MIFDQVGVDINEIIINDKEKFNSNNHWVDGKIPKDYTETLAKSNTDLWVNDFKPNHIKITVKVPDWMISAAMVSSKTGKFTNLYRDELEEWLLENKYDEIFNGTSYFVRVNNVSLKYGQHGVGPYFKLKEIIESTVSCIDGHKPLYADSLILNIYLFEWVPIKSYNEFRVFVYKNKITAISQQDIYNVYDELQNDNMSKIKLIVAYFEDVINQKIKHTDTYTYDFAFIENREKLDPYFIEMNSFGSLYAAGSALFHWILDHDILHNSDMINFRFTTRKSSY